jgi:hypothetical protein
VAGVTGAVWQLQSGSPASADVSTADSWTTLSGELASSDGSRTVTLDADISAPPGASPVLAVPGGSAVTLDLHGHKLAMGREAGDLKIIVPHGSRLSVEDSTAGSADAPASAIPLGGSGGYAGYGGLVHPTPSATPRPSQASGTAARVFGPIVEGSTEAENERGARHAAVAGSAPAAATGSTKAAPKHARAESDLRRSAQSNTRDERPRGRHRRENVARHAIGHSHPDWDCSDYYWDDEGGWWLDPDAP